MNSHDEMRKERITEYLKKMGISTSCSGYKALFSAIMIASRKPELSCAEIFSETALELIGPSVTKEQEKTIYGNAYYAIKHNKSVKYEGGPFNFIKDCSVELE